MVLILTCFLGGGEVGKRFLEILSEIPHPHLGHVPLQQQCSTRWRCLSPATDCRGSLGDRLRLIRKLRKENPNQIKVCGLNSLVGDPYKEFSFLLFI